MTVWQSVWQAITINIIITIIIQLLLSFFNSCLLLVTPKDGEIVAEKKKSS